MGFKIGLSIALTAAVLMAALAAGCGGGSSSSSGSSSSGGSTDSSSEAEGSASFLKPGTKSKLPKFGQEAEASEREAASAVLEENLQARASGDWATQCSSLTAGAIKKVEETPTVFQGQKSRSSSCPKRLEAQAQPLSGTKSIRADTMTGPIAALRVKGNKAYALYHGANGKDYAMPMEKVGDEWKVDSLITTEIH
jgi:hypothetical protein